MTLIDGNSLLNMPAPHDGHDAPDQKFRYPNLTFHAYVHQAETSGRLHLKVRQNLYGDDDLKARMQRLGSPARWDRAKWEWDYPLTPASVIALDRTAAELDAVIHWDDGLREMAAENIETEKYEENVRYAIERAIRQGDPLDPYPTNIMGGEKPPMRHQQLSYHWALRVSGLLLAHEPGLGKTRSAADAIGGWYREGIIRPMTQVWRAEAEVHRAYKGCWSVEGGVLVICPKVMMGTWIEELMMWQNIFAIAIDKRSRDKKIETAGMLAHAHVVNYESLPLIVSMISQYDALIVDESHRCANHSGQTLNALNLALNAKRRLLLTGTPVTNSLESVFYQMLVCDGGRSLGPSKTRFMEKYFNSEVEHTGDGRAQTKYIPRSGAVEEVSAAMSKHTYFLKKTDVLDLPEKTHTPILLDMTADQERYYNQVKEESIAYIQDSTVTADMAATRMMKLAQICQGFVLPDEGEPRHFTHAKREALIQLLTETYTHRKVVVWARFTYEIQLLCNMLSDMGIYHARYDGTIKSQRQRDRIKDIWNKDPNCRVFVGQLQMGIGITLHAAESPLPCCDTTYLGMDFSYINWKQTQDRIHRIGQRWPCAYNYLLTRNGIDHRMYLALLAKEETAEAVHKQGKDFYLSLLRDDTPRLAAID